METNMLRQLKDLMRKWKDSSDLGQKVFNTIRSAVLFFSGFVPDEPYARMFYKIYTGKDLNLEDPVYFNEIWKTRSILMRNSGGSNFTIVILC